MFRISSRALALGLAGALALVASGCTSARDYVHNGFKVGPEYAPPCGPVAEHWIDAADARVHSQTDDISHWWTVFNDPVLNDLVCDAYHQNLTLKEAGYRVLQARAQLGIFEDAVLASILDELRSCIGGAASRLGALRVVNLNQHDPVAIAIRPGIQKDVVDDAEDGSCRADSQSRPALSR